MNNLLFQLSMCNKLAILIKITSSYKQNERLWIHIINLKNQYEIWNE